MLPYEGELADDLRGDGVEVIVRPQLSVIRRSLAHPAGAAAVAGGALATPSPWGG